MSWQIFWRFSAHYDFNPAVQKREQNESAKPRGDRGFLGSALLPRRGGMDIDCWNGGDSAEAEREGGKGREG